MDCGHVIRIRGAQAVPRTRLICFPYAGGNPDEFRAWADEGPPDVEILTVRLPGHGVRIRERPHEDWESLLAEMFAELSRYLAQPHVLYGHSFGGRLAYELTHLAATEFPDRTQRLIVSGCRSPDRPQRRPFMHDRTDQEFLAVLREMGGMPDELLADDRLMKTLMPVLRGEFRLAEIWDDRHGQAPVEVPITAVYGRLDPIDDREAMLGWPKFSRSDCELVEIRDGGHFFPQTHRQELTAIITSRLG